MTDRRGHAVAVAWSPLIVGLLGLAELVPLVVFGLYGARWRTGSTGGR
jgi:hypothetical protein